jgi:hypothetical protein
VFPGLAVAEPANVPLVVALRTALARLETGAAVTVTTVSLEFFGVSSAVSTAATFFTVVVPAEKVLASVTRKVSVLVPSDSTVARFQVRVLPLTEPPVQLPAT